MLLLLQSVFDKLFVKDEDVVQYNIHGDPEDWCEIMKSYDDATAYLAFSNRRIDDASDGEKKLCENITTGSSLGPDPLDASNLFLAATVDNDCHAFVSLEGSNICGVLQACRQTALQLFDLLFVELHAIVVIKFLDKFAVFIAWHISWRLTQPILSLTRAARHWAESTMSYRAEPAGGPEFRETITQLNRMAATLETTLSDLRQANARLDEARKRDALTGLLRRGEWFSRLSEEHARFLRDEQVYAVAMFDIDHFKSVNDELGHQAGDSILAAIAQKLRVQVRRYDVLGRYGGEEFTLLMPNTRLGEALLITDRIRQEACAHLEHPGRGPVTVSVSAGVAEISPGMAGEDIIAAADEAMYEAKRSGRDQTRAARIRPRTPSRPGHVVSSGP